MQIKKTIKTSFFCIIALIGIIVGVYAFLQLKSEEEVYNTDLFSLIPSNSSALIQIHDLKRLIEEETYIDAFSTLLPEEKTLKIAYLLGKTKAENRNLADCNEIILSYHPQGILLLAKINKTGFDYLTQTVFRKSFSSFSPKHEIYNEADVYIYSTNEDDFFCYTYHKGALMGSYSIKLLRQAIDMYNVTTNLRSNPVFNSYVETAGKNTLATLFVAQNKEQPSKTGFLNFKDWIAGDISLNEDELWINGVILKENPTDSNINTFAQVEKDSNIFNYEMIPATHMARLIHFNTDSLHLNLVDSLLSKSVEKEVGICYLTKYDSLSEDCQVAYIKINTEIFNTELEERIRQESKSDTPKIKKISNSTHNPAHIVYETSLNLNKDKFLFENFFTSDSSWIFTVYNNYLLIALQEKHINQYIHLITPLLEDSLASAIKPNPMTYLLEKYNNEETNVRILIDGKFACSQSDIIQSVVPGYLSGNKDKLCHYNLLLLLHSSPENIYYNYILKKRQN